MKRFLVGSFMLHLALIFCKSSYICALEQVNSAANLTHLIQRQIDYLKETPGDVVYLDTVNNIEKEVQKHPHDLNIQSMFKTLKYTNRRRILELLSKGTFKREDSLSTYRQWAFGNLKGNKAIDSLGHVKSCQDLSDFLHTRMDVLQRNHKAFVFISDVSDIEKCMQSFAQDKDIQNTFNAFKSANARALLELLASDEVPDAWTARYREWAISTLMQ